MQGAGGGQDMVAIGITWELGEVTSYRRNGCQFNLSVTMGTSRAGIPLSTSLIRTITSWGLGQVCHKFSPVSRE